MGFEAKSGKKFSSKFRANRSDREGAVEEGMESQKAPEKPKGNRAQANAIEAKGQKEPVSGGASDTGGPVNAQGGLGKAKAREVHITHDHAAGTHHVSATMEDGSVQESDHATPEEAHFHGALAAGANEGNYPMEHENTEGKEAPDQDDYEVEAL